MRRRRNADDDIRKLERKAAETEDRADILAYWAASLRAGVLPKPTRVFENGNYVYVANINDYERDNVVVREEMPRIFVGRHIVLWDWNSRKLKPMSHDLGVFVLTPENLFALLQELVDYETT